MVTRTTFLAAYLCLATAASAFGQGLQGTGFLFQEPPTGSRLIAYIADRTNLNADLDLTGPQGVYKVIPTPNGSKFYLLNAGTLQALDSNLSTFRTINGIAGTIKDAQVTPNGQYLIIQADTMYVLNTQTDAVVATGLGILQTINAFAIDNDSAYVYIATVNGFAGSLTKISLANLQAVGTPLQLPYVATSLTFSPTGLLYAIFENRVLEIDAVKMQANNPVQFQFSAKPGPVHFTPNGKFAYFINTNPTGPGLTSMVRLNITDHTTLEWPPFNPNQTPPTFDDIYVVSDTRILTYAPATEEIYDIDPTTFQVTLSTLHPNPLFTGRVLGIAISNEIPSSRFLYALMDSGTTGSLVRVDLSTNTVSATTQSPTNQGKFQYVSIPPSAGATSLLLTNGTQVLQAGVQPLPLIIRVLDALGRPVFNQPVTFTTDPTNGAVIEQASVTTNAYGRVSNTVAIPTTPGTYVITAQAGAATATFQLTIPGAGGVIPGGPQLISTVIGNGTLLSELNISTVPWAPLTILVTDENGVPRAGVAVSFTLNKGIGGIRTPSTVTDENGLASTIYFTAPVPTGFGFINNIVRATVDSGFVDFNVTVFHQEQSSAGTGITPEISLPTPANGTLTIGRGQVINGAITARIISSAAPQVGFPITNVGLRIGDGVDPTINGQGSCIGNTLSDATGIATCNYKASCTLGQITENVVIGEFFGKPLKVNVIPGAASQIALSSGNLQSGKVGQTLADLVAVVTDGCGGPISGATVTMTLVSGSATLT
ncbi:MAG: Ig-like domain-containing protein, partial [Acidobacteriota bacterium]